MFVRQYLVEHNMEAMVEDTERKDGWCFFEPLDRNRPLISTAALCGVLRELNVQSWVKWDTCFFQPRDLNYVEKEPEIVWYKCNWRG